MQNECSILNLSQLRDRKLVLQNYRKINSYIRQVENISCVVAVREKPLLD